MNDVIEMIKQAKAKQIKVYPQYVTRASEIGHPCERYLVYSISNWNERQPHDPELEFIFEGGRLVEDLAIKDFKDAGFKVYRPEPDKAIKESKPRITGHIDIRVDFGDGQVYTGEIKGLNVWDWQKLNTLEDFFRSEKVWIKKYPAQLMTYLYMKGEGRGFFYLKSIPRFQPKLIWVDLDYDYMEAILQKTERIEAHVKAGTLPPPMDWDDNTCRYCPFNHICLPDRIGEEVEVIEDGRLLELLNRHAELKPLAKEFDDVDSQIKKLVEGREKIIVGDWFVTGKWIDKTLYNVPAEVKEPYKEVTQYWKKQIINTDKVKQEKEPALV